MITIRKRTAIAVFLKHTKCSHGCKDIRRLLFIEDVCEDTLQDNSGRKMPRYCKRMMLFMQLSVLMFTVMAVSSSMGPQYTDFIMPYGEGRLCSYGLSVDWLPNSSLVSCAVACIKHENCSAFHFYPDVMTCELRRGMCFGDSYMEVNESVIYYHCESKYSLNVSAIL